MPQDPVFVGIDVSKAGLDVHLHPTGEAFQVENRKAGWARLCRRLRALNPAAIALEASGGYERGVARALVGAGLPTYLLDPAQVRAFAKACRRHAKTDPIDAATIARCLQAALPELTPYRPDPQAERLRALVDYRARLVAERTALTSDRDKVEEPLVKRMIANRLNGLALALATLEREIARLCAEPAFAARHALITSMPGAGPVLASALLAHMPELGRIGSKKIAALAGLAPHARQSGQTDRGGKCGGGRPYIRRVLYMAALSAIRTKAHPLAAFYKHLRASGKEAKPAIVAAMRKLLTTLNAMIRDNKPWTPINP